MKDSERWVLGPDEDGVAFNRLLAALKSLGFKVDLSWPKSSEDLGRYRMSGPNGTLVMDAEDSEGLVVTAIPELISALQTSYEAQP